MNVGELAKGVAAATGTSEADAKKTITAVFDQIAAAAAKGEEISINGFGKFTVKDRPEREGRNPATGETMTIAASKKVAFTAAKGLKDKLGGMSAGEEARRRRREARMCNRYRFTAKQAAVVATFGNPLTLRAGRDMPGLRRLADEQYDALL